MATRSASQGQPTGRSARVNASNQEGEANTKRTFGEDVDGFVDMRAILIGLFVGVVGILVSIIGAVIGMQVLAGQIGPFFTAGSTVIQEYDNATLDNGGVADTVKNSFTPVIGLAIVFAPITLILAVVAAVYVVRGRGARSS